MSGPPGGAYHMGLGLCAVAGVVVLRSRARGAFLGRFFVRFFVSSRGCNSHPVPPTRRRLKCGGRKRGKPHPHILFLNFCFFISPLPLTRSEADTELTHPKLLLVCIHTYVTMRPAQTRFLPKIQFTDAHSVERVLLWSTLGLNASSAPEL
jgi:hypothetical protein